MIIKKSQMSATTFSQPWTLLPIQHASKPRPDGPKLPISIERESTWFIWLALQLDFESLISGVPLSIALLHDRLH
jgi:hypothetical protein